MSASVSGKMGATGRTVGSGVERSSAPGHGAALLRGEARGAGAARGGSMDSVQGAEACRCAPAGAFGYKAALSAGAREGCLIAIQQSAAAFARSRLLCCLIGGH